MNFLLTTRHLVISTVLLVCWYTSSQAESVASIQMPAPDLANYPNSAFTLPQQGSYIEMMLVYNAKTTANPAQYNLGYLLRYGLTDSLELRLQSNGVTVIDAEKTLLGIGPQSFDIKWHIMDTPINSFLPAMAIETALQTEWASPALNSGLQPALSINFDQNLNDTISIEYNIGFISQQTNSARNVYQLALSWAVQAAVNKDIAIFTHGYANTAAGINTIALGGGVQWLLTRRIALFANASVGLTSNMPELFSLLGFAIAF